MLNLRGLEVFLAAAESENFSLAARRLNLSQPAVTQQIQALERELGLQLFRRNGRRVKLSEAGQTLVPLAQDLIRHCKRVEETISSLSGQVVGHLIIDCSTTSGRYVLPGLLARFREQYPAVRATVNIRSRRLAIEQLLAGEAHITCTSARVERQGLKYQRFFEDEVVLIAPANHPWARRTAVKPVELLEENLVLREEESGTYRAVAKVLEEHDIMPDQLRVVMTLGSSEAIIMAVEEGIGLGFVPRIAAHRCVTSQRIVEIPLVGIDMRYTIYMACCCTRPATTAQARFWEFVQEPENQRLMHPENLLLQTRKTATETAPTTAKLAPAG
ncbi:MAG TPA: LysR family transcriptional regulator [Anaerolineae bacterium]|nr:LysR family transcriptional regulator [Anaerolineae bacterium]